MPKPKQFLKENIKKKSKHAQPLPTTADEYLSQGVDFEEAGEKWRGGDAVKSTRFFVRAIDCYDEALKKFPASFDLAYNKARVQYELTQHPKLLQQLPGTLLELLDTALISSRYALSLNPNNADVLFNTAQILTSVVEALDGSSKSNRIEPLSLLEEALGLFQRCLQQQEASVAEQQAQINEIEQDGYQESTGENEDGGVSLSSPSSTPSATTQEDDRWATVVEPVTKDTLVDTLLAMLETLQSICNLLPSNYPQAISTIESQASAILSTKFSTYLESTDREAEANLTRANFICAFTDAQFRSSLIPVSAYTETINDAYTALSSYLFSHPAGLCQAAESLITYNTSLRAHADGASPAFLSNRWKALSKALEYLTQASKLPDAENVEKIHLARGDVEILRRQLGGEGEQGFAAAKTNGPVLLGNAGKFYRGSITVGKSNGVDVAEAVVKEALAAGLGGDSNKLVEVATIKGEDSVRAVLEEAVEDGLVTIVQLKEMGIARL